MSGLRKAKKYDWKDSNMALFGSDTEKQVKKESASHELAWRNAGDKPGVQVWRIVKFKVTHWAKDDYGNFYNGDSYIVLNTYKEPNTEKLLYDVHFWIGKYSTQVTTLPYIFSIGSPKAPKLTSPRHHTSCGDTWIGKDEYGTAAYKTVELDTLLDGVPIQHREVQNMESDMFKSYFSAITIMEGGADTGFRSAREEKPIHRLFHFHGDRKGVVVKEIQRKRSNINSSDVYLLDLGLNIYQFNGKECNKDEKFKAVQYVQELRSKRNGKPKINVLDEIDTGDNHPFFEHLDQEDVDDDDDDDVDIKALQTRKSLYRLSNASGKLEFSLVSDGTVRMSDFKSEDVFIFDTRKEVFVWIGNATSEDEKKNGMPYAHNYLMETDHPVIPVTVLNEGQTSRIFQDALDG